MLVLTRRIGESIDIADGQVKITIIDVRGSKISIGIEADRSIKVLRSEMLRRTDDES